jgi:outer membrane immunogenic protein
MRRGLVVLCLLALMTQTNAQEFDVPTLRGTSPFIPVAPKYTRWDGVYVGGQVGYGMSNMDFRDAFDNVNIFDPNFQLTAPLGRVSSWASFGQKDVRAASYGGFIGYNAQFTDTVVGVELNLNGTSLFGSSSASRCYIDLNPACHASIVLGDGHAYDVNVNAAATARINGYGTLRARAGWAYENFLPYATAGVVVARAEVTRTATADATPTPTSTGTAFVRTETDRQTRFAWGWSAGVGLDYLIMRNVFLRGEYEYIKLNPVGHIELSINTVRAGAGVRF